MASWITPLIFVSGTLATFSLATMAFDWMLRRRIAARMRGVGLRGSSGEANGTSLFKDMSRFDRDYMEHSPGWLERLTSLLEKSNTSFTSTTFLFTSAALALALGAIGYGHSIWLAMTLALAGAVTPLLTMIHRVRKLQTKITEQLPEAFAMISRAVRAGQTVPSALQIIANDFEQPIAGEFSRCHEQQNLGISREIALRDLAKRASVMELQLFVVAVLVQSRSGCDLVELLDNLAEMVRKRLKLKDRIRALTGEGRMQARALLVLPLAAFIGIYFVAPEYISCLLERPGLLAATGGAQLVGVLWIRKIVNVNY